MSDEERAVIYELIDELLIEFDDIQEEWMEGYITTGEAIQKQANIRNQIREYREALIHEPPEKT